LGAERRLKSREVGKIHVTIAIKVERLTKFTKGRSSRSHHASAPVRKIVDADSLVAVMVSDTEFVGPNIDPPTENARVAIDIRIVTLKRQRRITAIDAG
jgi:hypothetical protein